MWLVARGSEEEEEPDGGEERGVEWGVEREDEREEWVGVGETEILTEEEEWGEDPTHFAYQTSQSL